MCYVEVKIMNVVCEYMSVLYRISLKFYETGVNLFPLYVYSERSPLKLLGKEL